MQRYSMPISPSEITTTDLRSVDYLLAANSVSRPIGETRLQMLALYSTFLATTLV